MLRHREELLPLAIYHCSIKIFSRGKGQSAVAAVAYRAAEKIQNEYDSKIHDFTKKSGVVYTEIMLPDHAPAEYADRTILWNAVEKIERAKNSQLAREIEVALPVELTLEQNKILVRDYVNQHFVSAGMCADFAIHDKKDGNPHAHIMLTMRPINLDGTWGDKQRKEYTLDKHGEKIYDPKKRQYKCKSIPTTDWNDQTKAEVWREAWAVAVNTALEYENHPARVDHRSYERQGIEQIPTIHLGAAAHQMEQKGIATDRGNRNREIRQANMQMQKLQRQIRELKLWLKRELMKSPQSALADVVEDILQRERQAKRPSDVRAVERSNHALELLRKHEIQDMAGLQAHLADMYREIDAVLVEMKPIDRKIGQLTEHIRQAGIRKKYRPIYEKYKVLKPRKQKKFVEQNREALDLYKSAGEYFKACFRGRETPTVREWKQELAVLAKRRDGLYDRYDSLRDEAKAVDRLRYNIENVLDRERARTRPRNRTRSQSMERG